MKEKYCNDFAINIIEEQVFFVDPADEVICYPQLIVHPIDPDFHCLLTVM